MPPTSASAVLLSQIMRLVVALFMIRHFSPSPTARIIIPTDWCLVDEFLLLLRQVSLISILETDMHAETPILRLVHGALVELWV